MEQQQDDGKKTLEQLGISTSIPSAQDIFVSRGHGSPSIATELLNTSEKPSEYWGRTIIDERLLQRKRRIIARYNIVHYGDPNVEGLQWVDLAGRQSIKGQARQEVVKIAIGQRINQNVPYVERFRTMDDKGGGKGR